MIPAEAVEAAEEAVIDAMIKHGPDGHIDGYQEIARAALEAAAPHMATRMADAWAEGAQAAFDVTREGFNGECVFMHCADDDYPPTNPYSGEKWEIPAEDYINKHEGEK